MAAAFDRINRQWIDELTKMGVLQSARGLKVGERLLQHGLKEARKRGFSELYLLTSWKCKAAIHLYERNGFRHDDELLETYGEKYQRCSVAMRYQLAPSA